LTPREEVLGIIRERRGYDDLLTVPRAFIRLTGDTDSALLLSQLLYWTERAASPQGWVYKSRDDWRLELGLNRYRLDRARRRLRDLGVLDEAHHLVGSRRILHLRPRCSDLCAALSAEPRDGGAGFRPRNRPAPAGTDVGEPSERSGMDRPECGFPAARAVEDERSERSNFDRSRTETTPETTPETTAETTGRSSNTRARGGEKRKEGESRNGALDGAADVPAEPLGGHGSPPLQEGTAFAPGGHGSPPLQEGTAFAPGGHGSPPLQEDTAMVLAEDRLFGVLERVSGFPRERDREQLRELLDDYPGVDHLLEFKKFAAFYEKRVLDRPWFALLNWVAKASLRAARGPAPTSSAGGPPPAGVPRPAPCAGERAEPLLPGVVVAGPLYRRLMRQRQGGNPAGP